jgi:DNA-directed RNA polymerase subunit RPC12/RpoP
MPDIVFDCPLCHKRLSIDEKGAGLVVDCPECEGEILIPKKQEQYLSNTQAPRVIILLVTVVALVLWGSRRCIASSVL